MHSSAMLNAKRFFDTYSINLPDGAVVIDLGSQDVNGSIKEVCPPRFNYVGVDFSPGKNVDLVMSDPYEIPIHDGKADIVVASSVFEHSSMFWLLFLDVLRILKPGGLFYLNVPSNGAFHRHPLDCWRFYPDAAEALIEWAKRSKQDAVFLECFVSAKGADGTAWNDFVAVFLKGESYVQNFPSRIVFDLDANGGYIWKLPAEALTNGRFYGMPTEVVLCQQDFSN